MSDDYWKCDYQETQIGATILIEYRLPLRCDFCLETTMSLQSGIFANNSMLCDKCYEDEGLFKFPRAPVAIRNRAREIIRGRYFPRRESN